MLYQWLLAMRTSDRGASMVEYALLVVLIAIVALVTVQFAGTELSETYGKIGTEVAKTNA